MSPHCSALIQDCGNHHRFERMRLRAFPARVMTRPNVSYWPIATDDALTADRRFRDIADMDRFSSRNDL